MRCLTLVFLAVAFLPSLGFAQERAQPQSQTYWTKPDFTQAAFNTDRYQCLQSAIKLSQRSAPAISMQPYGDMGDLIQMANQNDLFDACMAAKGYTLQSGTVAPPIAKPAPQITNMNVAYCLGAIQCLSKELNYLAQEKPNEAYYKTEIHKYDVTLQKLATYLTNAYGINGLPPEISAEIDKGNNERTEIAQLVQSGKDRWWNCETKCLPPDNKTKNCSQNCRQYISKKQHKIMDCMDLEKKLGT